MDHAQHHEAGQVMAGTPVRRERAKVAQAETEAARAELAQLRLALVRKGLDPADFGARAIVESALLTRYEPDLPLRVSRLASEGQSIEEIRVQLGFTDAQEREWCNSYVDFAAAVLRVRAREEAFWQGEARLAAKTGDRAAFNSLTALIERRFNAGNAAGNAADLVVVHIGKPLDEPVSKDG
jgi:hypothetical protein